jgi:hypothetical protein
MVLDRGTELAQQLDHVSIFGKAIPVNVSIPAPSAVGKLPEQGIAHRFAGESHGDQGLAVMVVTPVRRERSSLESS